MSITDVIIGNTNIEPKKKKVIDLFGWGFFFLCAVGLVVKLFW